MKQRNLLLVLVVSLTVSTPLAAVETTFWQVGTFEEFLQGTLSKVSVSREGRLRLAPEAQAVFNPEEALALSLAADRKRNVYIGTGHQGKVFRLTPDLKGSRFFTAQEPDVFALAVGPDDALYVGGSPEGKIYRVTPDGQSKVFYDPKAKYVWALVFDARGRLYVGTGDRGQILRIDPGGKGEVFFDSNQTHVMCLTLDGQGNLLAGTDPNGLIYRITPEGKAFVVYQASLPEIHELVTDSEGRIYAAALGGPGAKGTPELFSVPPPSGGEVRTPTTVTVTTAAESQTRRVREDNPPTSPTQSPSQPSFSRPAPTTVGLGMPPGTLGRGSIIRILPDSSAEPVWSSNNESAFGLAIRGNRLVFSTNSNGRIFDLDPSSEGQKLTLLAETRESLATRLLLQGSDLYVTTSNAAKVFRVGSSTTREGTYESRPKDTKVTSRWGIAAWRGDVPPGTSVHLFTRSGNSDRPDSTWSDWAGPYTNLEGSQILSPPARYIQWKAVLRGSEELTPALDEVTISYLNQNLPPQVRSLNVSTAVERTSPASAVSGATVSSGSPASISSATSFGGASAGSAAAKPPVILSWQAEDPNGDPLVYSVYIRSADEQEWHLLRDRLRQSSYQIEPTAIADGKYVARLVASDEDSNPADGARRAELISAPFWIDNTPPEVRVREQVLIASGGEVRFRVEDRTSPLQQAEVATDGLEWKPLHPEDGIADSRVETFIVRLPKREPGEHIILLRASDTAGNVGVGKAVVRYPPPERPGR